jgi:HAD superfamily hydrolase (TIGR01509 family)
MNQPDYLVLDAYGVLWQPGRDLEELLTPFLHARGCGLTEAEIIERYYPASLGTITSSDLWLRYGLEHNYDAEYLTGVTLSPGTCDVLAAARRQGIGVGVLSNDLTEWSLHNRRRFGLEPLVDHWVISGQVSLRKPEAAIFSTFAAVTGWPLARCLFVDDRTPNLDTARDLGMATVLFGAGGQAAANGHAVVDSFAELAGLLGLPPPRQAGSEE